MMRAAPVYTPSRAVRVTLVAICCSYAFSMIYHGYLVQVRPSAIDKAQGFVLLLENAPHPVFISAWDHFLSVMTSLGALAIGLGVWVNECVVNHPFRKTA